MCIIFIVLLDYTHTILAPKLAALLLFVQVAIATTLNANIDFFFVTSSGGGGAGGGSGAGSSSSVGSDTSAAAVAAERAAAARSLVGSTHQAYSSGFYFRIA